jgi:uncharacterized protein YprB with RNaseH-like and TPR domain
MTDLDGFEVGLHYEEYRAFSEPLPVEEIARYNVEDVRALACVAERLKQPGRQRHPGIWRLTHRRVPHLSD